MKSTIMDTLGSDTTRVLWEPVPLRGFATLLLGVLGAFLVFRTGLKLQRFVGNSSTTSEQLSPSSSKQDPNKNRQPGEWTPTNFQYPRVEACLERISDIKPIPYRPFKWGAYHVTMGLRSMPWTEWIELDKEHETYFRIKTHRVQTRGRAVVRVLGDDANPGVVRGAGEAAIELVHELAEYLSRRYPQDFEVVRHTDKGRWGWDDLPSIRTVKMSLSGVSFDLPQSVDDGMEAPERAMEIAGLLIQDDLALMIEGVDGRYYFQAGSICLPGSWRMQDKIGMPLEEIHLSGNVPQYKERLQGSLERFFQRLAVDKPVIRNNYAIQINGEDVDETDKDELAWARHTLGDEDKYTNGQVRGDQEEETRVECIRLRTERQTLRRLGRSGAVVFTIRTYLTEIRTLVEEEGVKERLASALRSWPGDVGEYKGKERGNWYRGLVEYLEGGEAMTQE